MKKKAVVEVVKPVGVWRRKEGTPTIGAAGGSGIMGAKVWPSLPHVPCAVILFAGLWFVSRRPPP